MAKSSNVLGKRGADNSGPNLLTGGVAVPRDTVSGAIVPARNTSTKIVQVDIGGPTNSVLTEYPQKMQI